MVWNIYTCPKMLYKWYHIFIQLKSKYYILGYHKLSNEYNILGYHPKMLYSEAGIIWYTTSSFYIIDMAFKVLTTTHFSIF